MTPTRRFRVKFASGDPDVFVDVEDTAVVKSVVDKVREIKGLPEGRFVRLLSAGHELYEEDAVLDAPGDVLHCVTSDYGPKRGPSGGRLRMTVDQLRGDWIS
ncbi:unnamed protein product [Ostreobium quekettii]|uniref:Ubiquitin-like domain-containing protein n=1 Tax=Ostreobium quekettii TaxID=121088 RepID=A0A8S1J3H9_9CHLO|nr:unnamed protein product [Ostreobium quekettii]